jgi:outer membrane protein OmpA-like peptidoglycan-associated protein
MTRSSLLAVGAFVFVAACGGKKPPEAPAPESKPAEAPAPAPAAPAPAPAPTDDAAAAARMAAERTRALTADLTTMIHFDFDRSDIMPEDRANLDRKAAILAANPAARIRSRATATTADPTSTTSPSATGERSRPSSIW